ncbi:LmbU family transcriptional regulator [Streptomyces sp. AM6-12]|uniref:LmbU family transcriptional regulator n=1 Tax=Streptomyces sp. AM6-12 TaxID=3345149 RepID=UPI0037B9A1C0
MRTASRHRSAPTATRSEPAQHDVVLSLVGRQAMVRKSALIFPENLSERSWERIGSNLRELTNSSAWWLADWLLFGEAAYGWRRYREAVERTGLDYQTLRNYAWVARRFERHRRRDGLSFAHHAEVARLPPPEQDQWLCEAERGGWSRNELRKAVRAGLAERSRTGDLPPADAPPAVTCPDGAGRSRGAPPRPAETAAAGTRPRKAATLTIELSADQLDYYSKSAAAHGLPVEQWVTRVLDATGRRTA